MSAKKSNLLPRLEVLIIIVFFLSFLGWVANKCTDTKAQYQEAATEVDPDSLLNAASAMEATTSATPESVTPEANTNITNPPVQQDDDKKASYLFVVIDGLKMRNAPNLQGDVLAELDLFDQVEFMNEVTDSTTQLKLSKDITANEPWVKVRNRKGREGWVYGAGVHYHRRKYPGL